MKTSWLTVTLTAALLSLCPSLLSAQESSSFNFTRFQLEARASFAFDHQSPASDPNATPGWLNDKVNTYGFRGDYFNLLVGGNLGDKFTYYFRQRIIANPGSSSLFDNTDFLYVNYKPSKNWSFRFGKDAFAIGGFEYDAPPIDVYLSSISWQNIYCFQLGASATFLSNDQHHSLTFQVANSPSVHSGGYNWNSGLLAYNLLWAANFDHFQTLYSVSMFQLSDNQYMNYITLGNRFSFSHLDFYIDFLHRALSSDDWGRDFSLIGRCDYRFANGVSIFAKLYFEQNLSHAEKFSSPRLDPIVQPGIQHFAWGIGAEYHPFGFDHIRIHTFLGQISKRMNEHYYRNHYYDISAPAVDDLLLKTVHSFVCNVGITWKMDFKQLMNKSK